MGKDKRMTTCLLHRPEVLPVGLHQADVLTLQLLLWCWVEDGGLWVSSSSDGVGWRMGGCGLDSVKGVRGIARFGNLRGGSMGV